MSGVGTSDGLHVQKGCLCHGCFSVRVVMLILDDGVGGMQ